ncbi:FAD-dependent monooxygenase [Plantactinospora sp. CA-290183]|uniref:FAD-dependent monooxygenase n=1 Tax=Plantactinospora sp. CA-290183 TaxID=3240006 RepID=UPI003D8EE5A1
MACGLLSVGVETKIIDGAAGPASTSRALGLQPRGVEVLDRLGALGDLPDRAVPIAGTVVRIDGVERVRLALPTADILRGRRALVISQADIEAQLRSRVAELGGQVEWRETLLGVEQSGERVVARLAGGAEIAARWLVGCDGARSIVRKSTGIRLVGRSSPERFLLADVTVRLAADRHYAGMWTAAGEGIVAIPLPGNDRWRLMAPHPPDQEGSLPTEAITALLARRLSRLGAGAGPIEDVAWTSVFRVHQRLAESYRDRRVFLAGDAAHISSPTGGQGMNTGLGDAENLAFKLALVAAGRASEQLLDSYEVERRPVAEAVVGAVGGVDKVLGSRNQMLLFVRDRIVLPLVNRPAVQRRIWQRASQLSISYHSGPLVPRPNRRYGTLRCGDRVPDLPCQRMDDTKTRLHAELRGHWVVLNGRNGLAELAQQRLGANLVSELYIADDEHALVVRPDGHLGWHGHPDPVRFGQWLDRVLTGTRNET